jgi:hypothetical protein
MSFLVLQAYSNLLRLEPYLIRHNFSALHERVRRSPLRVRAIPSPEVMEICRAVDLACVWYWKRALCLQRSAAAVCLLRRYGVRAQMVLASRPTPFQAHAWVEVDGKVVNDKQEVQETYAVLDRC